MFKKFIETLFWVRIVASPLIVGAILGFVCQLYFKDKLGDVLFGALAAAGLIVGIIWACNVKKKYGTSYFYSRVNASPDIDEAVRKKG